jgi:mRNA-degrading endonuclease RelE of RelBE toxin-antitoxin system
VFSFIETKLFTRLVQQYLTDDEYRLLQALLIEQPDAGDVIPNSGGVRKLRCRAPGRGKRGGYRIIYYLLVQMKRTSCPSGFDNPQARPPHGFPLDITQREVQEMLFQEAGGP